MPAKNDGRRWVIKAVVDVNGEDGLFAGVGRKSALSLLVLLLTKTLVNERVAVSGEAKSHSQSWANLGLHKWYSKRLLKRDVENKTWNLSDLGLIIASLPLKRVSKGFLKGVLVDRWSGKSKGIMRTNSKTTAELWLYFIAASKVTPWWTSDTNENVKLPKHCWEDKQERREKTGRVYGRQVWWVCKCFQVNTSRKAQNLRKLLLQLFIVMLRAYRCVCIICSVFSFYVCCYGED